MVCIRRCVLVSVITSIGVQSSDKLKFFIMHVHTHFSDDSHSLQISRVYILVKLVTAFT